MERFLSNKKNIKKDKGKKIRVWTQWFFFISESLEYFIYDIIKDKRQKKRFLRKKTRGFLFKNTNNTWTGVASFFVNRKIFLSMNPRAYFFSACGVVTSLDSLKSVLTKKEKKYIHYINEINNKINNHNNKWEFYKVTKRLVKWQQQNLLSFECLLWIFLNKIICMLVCVEQN